MKQKYTSAKTSVNTIPKVFKQCNFKRGSSILDYGGGKYDTAKEYIEKEVGVKLFVYDPYNRSNEHNESVKEIGKIKGFDYVTCNNVLNVIYEDDVIVGILNELKSVFNGRGSIYIQVYEGNRGGLGKETSKGYQRHEKAVNYEGIISSVFNQGFNMNRKGNIFILEVIK